MWDSGGNYSSAWYVGPALAGKMVRGEEGTSRGAMCDTKANSLRYMPS